MSMSDSRRPSRCASTRRVDGGSTPSPSRHGPWAGATPQVVTLDEDQGRSGAIPKTRARVRAAGRGGRAGRGRDRDEPGALAPVSQRSRLAPPGPSMPVDGDAHRRRARPLRPDRGRRPDGPGDSRTRERARAGQRRAPHGGGPLEQGAAWGGAHGRARRLRGGRDRGRRGSPATKRWPMRSAGSSRSSTSWAARGRCSSGGSRRGCRFPCGRAGAGARPVDLDAGPLPGDPRDAAPSHLRRRVRVRADRDAPRARPGRPAPPPGPAHPPAARAVAGVDPRSPSGVHLVRPVPAEPGTLAATTRP